MQELLREQSSLKQMSKEEAAGSVRTEQPFRSLFPAGPPVLRPSCFEVVPDSHFLAIKWLWWKAVISVTNRSGLGNCILFKPRSSLLPGSQRPET